LVAYGNERARLARLAEAVKAIQTSACKASGISW
jgi:hypothetical protein